MTPASFTLPGVAAMSYRVNLQGLPTGGYLVAGRFGSNDALGDPVSMDHRHHSHCKLDSRRGQVAVRLRILSVQPFAGAINGPHPAVRNRVDLYKTATSDQACQVVFAGVAPGDYKVIAWEGRAAGCLSECGLSATL
jgi:hypothetical protein